MKKTWHTVIVTLYDPDIIYPNITHGSIASGQCHEVYPKTDFIKALQWSDLTANDRL